jgi:hypothetical protein
VIDKIFLLMKKIKVATVVGENSYLPFSIHLHLYCQIKRFIESKGLGIQSEVL